MTSNNSFNRFQSLLGKSSLDVVTVTTNNGDGTSQATTMGGSVITIKGESVLPPNNAFVKDGEIIRQAPNLTVTELVI